MNDKQIVLGLKSRQEKAFDQFYKQYKNLIFYVAYDILEDKEEAKDVLEETLISVYEKIDTFKDGNFKAWFLKIAKSKAIDRYRQSKRFEQLDFEPKAKEGQGLLFLDLKKILKEDEYQVLIMHTVYDMKHKDIALYLDKPIGTITWLYQEAIKKAKKRLEVK